MAGITNGKVKKGGKKKKKREEEESSRIKHVH
jgi:hypothetical protein